MERDVKTGKGGGSESDMSWFPKGSKMIKTLQTPADRHATTGRKEKEKRVSLQAVMRGYVWCSREKVEFKDSGRIQHRELAAFSRGDRKKQNKFDIKERT